MKLKLKKKIKPYLLLLPALAVLLGIFAAGLILGFLQSLGYSPLEGRFNLTAEHYAKALSASGFYKSLLFSLKTSAVSSAIAVVVGVMLAYMLLKSRDGMKAERIAYKLPVVVPHLVASLLAYSVLSQSGILARLAYMFGLIEAQEQFPSLLFDRGGVGIIAAYVWKGAPYIAMVTYSVLRGINENLVDAARNLGATDRQILSNILLPISTPTIFSSFIIIFAFSFGAFEIPYLLGPTSPRAIPVEAYVQYINPDWSNRPYAMAISMISAAMSFIMLMAYQKLFEKIRKYGR